MRVLSVRPTLNHDFRREDLEIDGTLDDNFDLGDLVDEEGLSGQSLRPPTSGNKGSGFLNPAKPCSRSKASTLCSTQMPP